MTHEIHRALNANCFPADFVRAMQKAWCRETCWERNAAQYDARKNPALGQCLVTTLAAWASADFQDRIQTVLVTPSVPRAAPTVWHFNLRHTRLGGFYDFDADLTCQQFPRDSQFEVIPRIGDAYMFHYEMAYGSLFEPRAAHSLERRLALFLSRLESEGGYRIGHSAGEILARAETEFGHVRQWAARNHLPMARPRDSQKNGGSAPAPGL